MCCALSIMVSLWWITLLRFDDFPFSKGGLISSLVYTLPTIPPCSIPLSKPNATLYPLLVILHSDHVTRIKESGQSR